METMTIIKMVEVRRVWNSGARTSCWFRADRVVEVQMTEEGTILLVMKSPVEKVSVEGVTWKGAEGAREIAKALASLPPEIAKMAETLKDLGALMEDLRRGSPDEV